MHSVKGLLLLLVALQFIGLPCSTAEKVVLDVHSDTVKKLLGVTCLYGEDYNDFWVYGYPVALPEYDDVYPIKRGFWTAGLAQRCEMHYFGGPQMPMATSLTIRYYLQGNTAQVLVSSKLNDWEEEYTDVIGMVSEKDGVKWAEITFDLTNRARAFKFTLISQGDDILLLDKITFDLGDDVTTPTEPPAPTTVRPIDGNNTVVLDTDNDYWLLWEEDCHYADDYSYLWAYGCPAHELNKESLDTRGFWNPCNAKNCTLRFKGNASLVPYTPDLVKIRGYVDGGSEISVTIQSNHDDVCENGTFGCWEVGSISQTDPANGWVEMEMTQELMTEIYTINIQLIPGKDGMVLLDSVSLFEPTNIPTTVETTTSASNTTATDSSKTTGSSGSSTTPKSGAGNAKMQWHFMAHILIITVIFSVLNK